ncbi:MAG: putative membrane protein YphA (DoxX/SURF4 family) [Ulvibacter sp.]|jgi:uncharacterized membrane protein YphA (DoxX/SURF4 family)
MKILILILQILAAVGFIMTGIMKIFTPYEDLIIMETWAGLKTSLLPK